MGKNNNSPSENKAFDKEIEIEETREYLEQLLNRVCSGHDIATDDAIALASLAASIDKFLIGSETERRSALTLKKDLCQIASNSGWQKNTQNTKRRNLEEQTFYTSDGQVVYLGSMLGSGGEGAVYKVPNMPGKVAKIFKSTADKEYMERKIDAIINNHIPSRLDNILVNTIPETSLYDEDDNFVGYVMPYITTKFKLYDVTRNSATRKKYFPELDYKGLIIIAYNLAEVVHYMQEHDVVIGDLNHNNVVVNPDGTVCLIDTDSYDVVDNITKEHFPCMVGFPELLAPELQTVGKLKNGRFTVESDSFSLAILIFRLLMSNADPFGGVRTSMLSMSITDIPANASIINGECPYIKTIEGLKIPDWAPSFDILPEYIKNLFERAFGYDKNTYTERIKARPTASEWMDALMRFYNEPLKQCKRDSFHWYLSKFEECPLCSKANASMAANRIKVKEKKKGILDNLANIITVEI